MARFFAAIDTSVLLALANGDESCQSAFDLIQKKGGFGVVTETVLQELQDMASTSGPAQSTAKLALSAINGQWGFLAPALAPLDNGIADAIAEKLLCKCLPTGLKNDALVLLEAACVNCALLLTFREGLNSANANDMALLLIEHHQPNVLVITPRELVEGLSEAAETPSI